jgi:hypothetical protein
MEKDKEPSIWSELWDSIKFCKESKSGKYSLDTYLDIVGEYTDRQIESASDEGLTYLGGECQITNSTETNTYDFAIQMFFEDSNGEKVSKTAKRNLPKERFVSEMDREVGNKIKFEIQKPY